MFKRFYSSKIWSYAEATRWKQGFNQSIIPKEHISISFSRSSGPGGQNVNKGMIYIKNVNTIHKIIKERNISVSTKVDLRLSLAKATWLPDYAKDNLRNTSQLRKSKSDELIVTSDKTRSQAKNIQDCYEKLVNVIKESVSVIKEPDQTTLAKVEKL